MAIVAAGVEPRAVDQGGVSTGDVETSGGIFEYLKWSDENDRQLHQQAIFDSRAKRGYLMGGAPKKNRFNCPRCPNYYSTFRGLSVHFQEGHADDIRDEPSYDEMKNAMKLVRETEKTTLHESEVASVRPGRGINEFQCIVCNPPRYLRKTSAPQHFARFHPAIKTKGWALRKDATVILCAHNTDHCKFERLFEQYMADGAGGGSGHGLRTDMGSENHSRAVQSDSLACASNDNVSGEGGEETPWEFGDRVVDPSGNESCHEIECGDEFGFPHDVDWYGDPRAASASASERPIDGELDTANEDECERSGEMLRSWRVVGASTVDDVPVSYGYSMCTGEGGWRNTDGNVLETEIAALHGSMTALRGELRLALDSKVERIPMPQSLAVDIDATKWTKAELKAGAKRNPCPIRSCDHPPIEGFSEHLTDQGLQDESIIPNMLALRRLFGSFDFKLPEAADKRWYIGFLVTLYRERLLSQVLHTQIYDPLWSWTGKIVVAADHLCHFAALECGRLGWQKGRTDIECLAQESLCPRKWRCAAARRILTIKRNKADGIKHDNLPLVPAMKMGVAKAMKMLYNIREQYKGDDDIPSFARARANVAMVGIIYCNGFAGRSGEWQIMKRQHVVDQIITKGLDHLVCPEHKTAQHYGELAKWIAPGTAEAIKVYLGLPGKYSPLFLEPVYRKTKHENVHSCLRRFGKMFWPGKQAPACNLMRKWYHRMLIRMARDGKCINLIAKPDAHSEKVALQIYVTTNAKDDAYLGSLLVKEVLKEPQAWPTEDELKDKDVYDIDFGKSVYDDIALERHAANSDDEDERFLDADFDFIPTFHTDANPLGVLANTEFDEPMPLQNDMAANIVAATAAGAAHTDGGVATATLPASTRVRKSGVVRRSGKLKCGDGVNRGKKQEPAALDTARVDVPLSAALVPAEAAVPSSCAYATSQTDASQSSTSVAARRSRRSRGTPTPLDGFAIRRSGTRTYLAPEQNQWRDEWLRSNGFDKKICYIVDAEQCIADGIRAQIWGLYDPPTARSIAARASQLGKDGGNSST